MRPRQQGSFAPYKSGIVELKGGINENVSSLELQGGELLNCKNYMMAEGGYGGYKSIRGYERFDGILKPSAYESQVLLLYNCSVPILAGDIIEGVTSLETAEALGDGRLQEGAYIDGDATVRVEVPPSDFTIDEALEVSSVTVGYLEIDIDATGGTDMDHDAIEYARGQVTQVPGEGSILGLHIFKSLAYAFRKKVGLAQVGLYVESGAGWTEIDTSASPLVYSAGEHDFHFTNYNFYATAGTYSMYWSDSVNKARGYNGTSVVVIDNSGMDPNDKPLNIIAHNFYLFLVYPGGSLQHSALGDPTDWTVPGEIGTGNDITNLVSGVQSSLVILMEEGISVLSGIVASDFSLSVFSPKSGAYHKTAQRLLGTVYFTDDRGVTTLEATDTYGDYAANSISQRFKVTLQSKLELLKTSTVSRDLNQYRLFFTDRTQIIMSFEAKEFIGATFVEYNKSVDVLGSGEDVYGADKNIFASDDDTGYVYRMDSGTNFDGEAITCRMSTAFYHYGSPRQWKAFKKATMEIFAEDNQEFNVKVDFDYNEATGARTIWYLPLIYNPEGGAIYGESIWGVMKYGVSAAATNRLPVYIQGVGTNMSYKIISNETYRSQHVIQNIITDYSVQNRRL